MTAGSVNLPGSYQMPWIYPLKPAECIILKEEEEETYKEKERKQQREDNFYCSSSFNFPFN